MTARTEALAAVESAVATAVPFSRIGTVERARRLVERLGEAATPGPWSRALATRTKSAIQAPTPGDAEFHQQGRDHVAICSVPHLDAGGGFIRARSGRDLDWIAAMGPQVAGPLAQVLRRAAISMAATDHANREVGALLDYDHAAYAGLALAKALLGEDDS